LWEQIPPWVLNGAKEGTPSMGPIMIYDYYCAGWNRILASIRMSLEDKIEENAPNIRYLAHAILPYICRLILLPFHCFRCPTLILSGDKDPIAPFEWCQQLATLIPMSKHVCFNAVVSLFGFHYDAKVY
jgi:hypothetical protein